MKKYVACAGVFFLSTSGFASLSPYWNSVNKITAIMMSSEVSGKLMQIPIRSIKQKSEMSYVVKAGKCSLKVKLGSEKPDRMGPTQFKVEGVSELKCS